MRALLISRAYPPQVGGIERQNYELFNALGKFMEVDLCVNRHGRKFIPLFLLAAAWRAFTTRRHYDVVVFGDGVLACLRPFISGVLKKPVVCIIHGLDITYASRFYQQFWPRRFIAASDHVVAVGQETIEQAAAHGIERSLISFIPNGVAECGTQRASPSVLDRLGFGGHSVLLTVGRLVKRKGVAWFIRSVMPQLPDDVIYLVAGLGPDLAAIQEAVREAELGGRVFLLGRVTEEDKQSLLTEANLFVQPNIPVEGDIEGFGLVVLEAAAHGTYVVASRLEGLKDAIKDGVTGALVSPLDAVAYRDTIMEFLECPAHLAQKSEGAREFVVNERSWSSIAGMYASLIVEVAERKR